MKLAIVHFQPLEYYPPVTNLLNYLSGKDRIKVSVYTTVNNKQRAPYENKEIAIFRSPLPFPNETVIGKTYKYWLFNFVTILRLVKLKPQTILYYESYSAFPVYIYSRFLNQRSKIYIHFHEYSSKEWYKQGMKLVRWYHKLEQKYLWNKASWISQTNKDRIRLFLTDYPQIPLSKMKTMPNYPPQSWTAKPAKKEFDKIRCVYIGSLSLQSAYIKEFCEWVANYSNIISLDIYSYNIHEDTKIFLKTLNSLNIRFFEKGIEYDKIPEILDQYNVGLIMYRCLTENVKYCASNKLFEYLSRGLDVWFHQDMVGSYSYITTNEYPMVRKINYQNLNFNLIKETMNREDLVYKPFSYTCEQVFDIMLNHVYQNRIPKAEGDQFDTR